MGEVLAVVSQKGGVGKTTTAVNLGAAFARRGLKTLIVDTDPQGAVRYGVGLKRGHEQHGLADFLNGSRALREVVLATQIPWLRVVLAGTVSDEANHDAYEPIKRKLVAQFGDVATLPDGAWQRAAYDGAHLSEVRKASGFPDFDTWRAANARASPELARVG